MSDITNSWLWIGFSIFLVIALSVDTFLLNKNHARPHTSMRVAILWTLIWVSCALIFNAILWVYLYFAEGLFVANEKSLDFLAGYLIEKSLSVDNIFVFYIIFHQFRIPPVYQQRIFSYGIWSAIVLRLVLILIGTWLVEQFHWILYIMGVFLLLTGIRMLMVSHDEKNIMTSRTYRWLQKYIRMTDKLHEQHFFIRHHHLLYATPLFVALIFIEISDLIFAFDSIPAIFAITTDPFLVWTSNIFAILGLRALYFLLAGAITRFHLLKYGIALILVCVGGKMVIAPWITIPIGWSLSMIIGILLLFSGLSVLRRP